MRRDRPRRSRVLFVPVLLTVGVLAAATPIKQSWWSDWDNEYPTSQSDDNVINGTTRSCQLCHEDVNGGEGYNAYGWELWQLDDAGFSASQAITMAASLDSDGDGNSNLAEITAGTQPGWTTGNNNTIYFSDGSTSTGKAAPPAILGSLDPPTCGAVTNYCTAGISASGCQASLSTSGSPSASAPSGFTLIASNVEGNKDGVFFQGLSGRQANPWGNGTSYQCVVPPVTRTGVQQGIGASGGCGGSFLLDLNAYWTIHPGKNPGAGATVQAQLWYRDPNNGSNQPTSFSSAVEFVLGP